MVPGCLVRGRGDARQCPVVVAVAYGALAGGEAVLTASVQPGGGLVGAQDADGEGDPVGLGHG